MIFMTGIQSSHNFFIVVTVVMLYLSVAMCRGELQLAHDDNSIFDLTFE